MSEILSNPNPAKHTTRSFEQMLVRTQAIAGALFSIFVLLHLSNVAIAPFGIDAFNSYQRTIRQIYQYPLFEILVVLGPLVTHAVAGVWLYFLRRTQRRHHRRPMTFRLQSWAGLFLLLFITGHVLAVRGPSFVYGVFPEFEGLAFSLWFFPAYFYPYYFLLALAGFYHATNGLRVLAARQGLMISQQAQLVTTLIAAFWILLSLMAFGGLLFDTGNPTDNDFARLGKELFDMDPSKPWR